MFDIANLVWLVCGDTGGIITSEDLRDYEPRVHEYALNFTMGKYTFHVPNAPFGGPVLAMILKILHGE